MSPLLPRQEQSSAPSHPRVSPWVYGVGELSVCGALGTPSPPGAVRSGPAALSPSSPRALHRGEYGRPRSRGRACSPGGGALHAASQQQHYRWKDKLWCEATPTNVRSASIQINKSERTAPPALCHPSPG